MVSLYKVMENKMMNSLGDLERYARLTKKNLAIKRVPGVYIRAKEEDKHE